MQEHTVQLVKVFHYQMEWDFSEKENFDSFADPGIKRKL